MQKSIFKSRQKAKLFFLLRNISIVAVGFMTGGCSAVSTFTTVANIALDVAGIKKNGGPELLDTQKPPRNISIRLHAGENLNADANGRSLAIVARIYKLRQNAVFLRAPFDSFLTPQKEKEMLGNDLLEVKEITLIPGQRFQVSEKVAKEAYFIGVVALFHSPAPYRWRVAFLSDDAEKSGITIGVHACALSVGVGRTTGDNDDFQGMQAPLHCL